MKSKFLLIIEKRRRTRRIIQRRRQKKDLVFLSVAKKLKKAKNAIGCIDMNKE